LFAPYFQRLFVEPKTSGGQIGIIKVSNRARTISVLARLSAKKRCAGKSFILQYLQAANKGIQRGM
jgi:hypothetical protein